MTTGGYYYLLKWICRSIDLNFCLFFVSEQIIFTSTDLIETTTTKIKVYSSKQKTKNRNIEIDRLNCFCLCVCVCIHTRPEVYKDMKKIVHNNHWFSSIQKKCFFPKHLFWETIFWTEFIIHIIMWNKTKAKRWKMIRKLWIFMYACMDRIIINPIQDIDFSI